MQNQVHFFLMKNWSWYKMQGPGGISRTILLPKPALYPTWVDVFCSGNSDPDYNLGKRKTTTMTRKY